MDIVRTERLCDEILGVVLTLLNDLSFIIILFRTRFNLRVPTKSSIDINIGHLCAIYNLDT